MSDPACAQFLQWALPRLNLRWTGFRNLRGQVCKRIHRRIAELGLDGLEAYRARLESEPGEWTVLDGLCFVTISRFHRDARTWDALRTEVLPSLAEDVLRSGEDTLRCWSIGCASGEEPYTLSIVWTLGVAAKYPDVRLRVLATDQDETVLERARRAVYPEATLRELPPQWRDEAFEPRQAADSAHAARERVDESSAIDDVARTGPRREFRLREPFRASVEFRRHDVRGALPEEQFHLVLCRNVIFTYFAEALQRETLSGLTQVLREGGAFVVGRGERLPACDELSAWHEDVGIFRRER